jgi:hypothetical protein
VPAGVSIAAGAVANLPACASVTAGIYPGSLLRAVPLGARPYLEVLPAADHAPLPSTGPISTSWALQALDRAIAEKEVFLEGISSMAATTPGGGAVGAGGTTDSMGFGADGNPMAGDDVLAAIDRVMAQREGVLQHIDDIAASRDRNPIEPLLGSGQLSVPDVSR